MPTEKPLVVVVMAASAGGVEALSTVLRGLDKDFPAPIVIVQHRPAHRESHLPSVLGRKTTLPVAVAVDGETLKPGHVYIARADQHLTVTDAGRFAYSNGHRIRHVLSSANPLFASVAQSFGAGAIGLVLTGTDADATDGVQAVKQNGGIVIAQDQRTSQSFGMPRSAIATGAVDYVLPIDEIAPALTRLVGRASSSDDAEHIVDA